MNPTRNLFYFAMESSNVCDWNETSRKKHTQPRTSNDTIVCVFQLQPLHDRIVSLLASVASIRDLYDDLPNVLKYPSENNRLDTGNLVKIERLLISLTAPKPLKIDACKEITKHLIVDFSSSFMKEEEGSDQSRPGNLKEGLSWWSRTSSLDLRPYIVKFSRNTEGHENLMLQLMTSAIKIGWGNINPICEVIQNNSVMVASEEVTFLFKVSEDGFYIMIIGMKKSVQENREALDENAYKSLKDCFGNDIKIVDVLSELPSMKLSQEECNPKSSSIVVGEMIHSVSDFDT